MSDETYTFSSCANDSNLLKIDSFSSGSEHAGRKDIRQWGFSALSHAIILFGIIGSSHAVGASDPKTIRLPTTYNLRITSHTGESNNFSDKDKDVWTAEGVCKHSTQHNRYLGNEVVVTDYQKLIDALSDENWNYRTIKGLQSSTGLSAKKISGLISKHQDNIREALVPNEYGEPLFTLRSRGPSVKEKLAFARMILSKSIN